MSLLGTGAVAIWHDIAPEGRQAFYDWHGNEHMPERLSIPGFRRGRRFVAIEADLEYFNLYEAETVEVLRGDGYRARLNNPSPWTIRTVKHFRSVARSICRVVASQSKALGGLVATIRYDLPDSQAKSHLSDMMRELIPSVGALAGIAGVHLLIADEAASGERTAEQKARGGVNAVPRYALLVEGWGDEADFMDGVRASVSPKKLGVAGPLNVGFYRHQITLSNG
jgi:hypothetical protein